MSDIALHDSDIVYYVAMSLDGYIADADDKVDWLNPYFIPELGFHAFMAQVRGVILGRKTYDFIEAYGKWPYGEAPGTVATHRPLGSLAGPLTAASGTPGTILAAARNAGPGPYWIVGGAVLASNFMVAGLLTRLDIFIVPEIIGSGTRAFSPNVLSGLGLIDTKRYSNDVVRLSYRPKTH